MNIVIFSFLLVALSVLGIFQFKFKRNTLRLARISQLHLFASARFLSFPFANEYYEFSIMVSVFCYRIPLLLHLNHCATRVCTVLIKFKSEIIHKFIHRKVQHSMRSARLGQSDRIHMRHWLLYILESIDDKRTLTCSPR